MVFERRCFDGISGNCLGLSDGAVVVNGCMYYFPFVRQVEEKSGENMKGRVTRLCDSLFMIIEFLLDANVIICRPKNW